MHIDPQGKYLIPNLACEEQNNFCLLWEDIFWDNHLCFPIFLPVGSDSYLGLFVIPHFEDFYKVECWVPGSRVPVPAKTILSHTKEENFHLQGLDHGNMQWLCWLEHRHLIPISRHDRDLPCEGGTVMNSFSSYLLRTYDGQTVCRSLQ